MVVAGLLIVTLPMGQVVLEQRIKVLMVALLLLIVVVVMVILQLVVVVLGNKAILASMV